MKRFRQLASEIRALLLTEWDPIGVHDIPSARDEYDEYVGPITKMITEAALPSEICDYLLSVERKEMGLTGDQRRAQLVAGRLAELRTRE
jgi:hypothetical protein